MQYTNRLGVPPRLAQIVISNDVRPCAECDEVQPEFHVSQLASQTPQMTYLREIHQHEIETDVSELEFAMRGQLAHSLAERVQSANAFTEQHIHLEIEGAIVVTHIDLYEDGELVEFKFPDISAVRRGMKDDWVKQINFQAVFVRALGFPVDRLTVEGWATGWTRGEWKNGHENGYPPHGGFQWKTELWSPDKAAEELATAVREHAVARGGNYRECRDEERWVRNEEWAVIKGFRRTDGSIDRKQKNATAVFGPHTKRGGGPDEAAAFIESKRPMPLVLEYRPGEFSRCVRGGPLGKASCALEPWCLQQRRTRNGGTNGEDN